MQSNALHCVNDRDVIQRNGINKSCIFEYSCTVWYKHIIFFFGFVSFTFVAKRFHFHFVKFPFGKKQTNNKPFCCLNDLFGLSANLHLATKEKRQRPTDRPNDRPTGQPNDQPTSLLEERKIIKLRKKKDINSQKKIMYSMVQAMSLFQQHCTWNNMKHTRS